MKHINKQRYPYIGNFFFETLPGYHLPENKVIITYDKSRHVLLIIKEFSLQLINHIKFFLFFKL